MARCENCDCYIPEEEMEENGRELCEYCCDDYDDEDLDIEDRC